MVGSITGIIYEVGDHQQCQQDVLTGLWGISVMAADVLEMEAEIAWQKLWYIMIPPSSVRNSQGIDLELSKNIMVLGLHGVPCVRHLLIAKELGPTSAMHNNPAASSFQARRFHSQPAGIRNLSDNFSFQSFHVCAGHQYSPWTKMHYG